MRTAANRSSMVARIKLRPMTIREALRTHWALYLIEAGGLGVFMVSAGLACTLLESPASPIHAALPDPLLRRFLMGLVMGGTAVALIYSRWGGRSGAHFNPALTLTFAVLGKIARADAALYIVSQFVGGLCGVLLTAWWIGPAFTAAPVLFVVTVPGRDGVAVAFAMELLISAVLMAVTLYASNRPRLMRYTGLLCGLLIVLFVTFEAPYSGMSMNPARTVASAVPSGVWSGAWLYFLAPPCGMLSAALVWQWLHQRRAVACAKLNHDTDTPCHFVCRFAAQGLHVPSYIRQQHSPDILEKPVTP